MGSEGGEVGDKIRKLLREVEEYHWTTGQMTCASGRDFRSERTSVVASMIQKVRWGTVYIPRRHHASCLGPWLEYAVRNSLLSKTYINPQVCINQFLPYFLKGMVGGTENYHNKQLSSTEGEGGCIKGI